MATQTGSAWYSSQAAHSVVGDQPAAVQWQQQQQLPASENALKGEWRELTDPSTGRPFFRNDLTGQTQWERPGWRPPAPERATPDGWTQHTDPGTGRPFWRNSATGESRWEPPNGGAAGAAPAGPRAGTQPEPYSDIMERPPCRGDSPNRPTAGLGAGRGRGRTTPSDAWAPEAKRPRLSGSPPPYGTDPPEDGAREEPPGPDATPEEHLAYLRRYQTRHGAGSASPAEPGSGRGRGAFGRGAVREPPGLGADAVPLPAAATGRGRSRPLESGGIPAPANSPLSPAPFSASGRGAAGRGGGRAPSPQGALGSLSAPPPPSAPREEHIAWLQQYQARLGLADTAPASAPAPAPAPTAAGAAAAAGCAGTLAELEARFGPNPGMHLAAVYQGRKIEAKYSQEIIIANKRQEHKTTATLDVPTLGVVEAVAATKKEALKLCMYRACERLNAAGGHSVGAAKSLQPKSTLPSASGSSGVLLAPSPSVRGRGAGRGAQSGARRYVCNAAVGHRVRSAPALDAAVVGALRPGEICDVLSVKQTPAGRWAELRSGGWSLVALASPGSVEHLTPVDPAPSPNQERPPATSTGTLEQKYGPNPKQILERNLGRIPAVSFKANGVPPNGSWIAEIELADGRVARGRASKKKEAERLVCYDCCALINAKVGAELSGAAAAVPDSVQQLTPSGHAVSVGEQALAAFAAERARAQERERDGDVAPEAPHYVVTGNSAKYNVRAEPDFDGEIIATLAPGEVVAVESIRRTEDGKWAQLSQGGWCLIRGAAANASVFLLPRNPSDARQDQRRAAAAAAGSPEDQGGTTEEACQAREEARASPGYHAMAAQRQQLPFAQHRDRLVQMVRTAQVTIVSGETGSGKSTQVPQYILDAALDDGQPARVLVTQPRRVAALSLAARVAEERGEPVGASVGYQVRLDQKYPAQSSHIIFMTCGVLLRRLQSDPELSMATHVVLDEVHERDLYIDFGMTILRDVLRKRPDLKVVIMSATLQAGAFQSYFGAGTALCDVPGRMFPVTEHYLEDFGGSLAAPPAKRARLDAVDRPPKELDVQQVLAVMRRIEESGKEGGILIFIAGIDDIVRLQGVIQSGPKYTVVVLHSSIPPAMQQQLFQPPQPGTRKVVISTNIAETSVTVPDIVFVIDTGRIKEKTYDPVRRVSGLDLRWITKSSAKQRRGRAGRVQEGVCYRLYGRAHHEAMEVSPVPEMRRSPLEEVCLQIRYLRLAEHPQHFLRECLDPPSQAAVEEADRALRTLRAVDDNGHVTPLGRLLARMPMHPATGKMLVYSAVLGCMDPVLTIASAQGIRDPFMLGPPSEPDRAARLRECKQQLGGSHCSDHIAVVEAYSQWSALRQRNGPGAAMQFAERYSLSGKSLGLFDEYRRHFVQSVRQLGFETDPRTPGPPDYEAAKAVLCGGLYPNIAQAQLEKRTVNSKGKLGFRTQVDRSVMIYNTSVCAKQKHFDSPYFIFSEKGVYTDAPMKFIRDVSMVSPYAIVFFGGPLTVWQGNLTVDGWLKLVAEPRVAALISQLRRALDAVMDHKVQTPHVRLTSAERQVIDAVVTLIREGCSRDEGGWDVDADEVDEEHQDVTAPWAAAPRGAEPATPSTPGPGGAAPWFQPPQAAPPRPQAAGRGFPAQQPRRPLLDSPPPSNSLDLDSLIPPPAHSR